MVIGMMMNWVSPMMVISSPMLRRPCSASQAAATAMTMTARSTMVPSP